MIYNITITIVSVVFIYTTYNLLNKYEDSIDKYRDLQNEYKQFKDELESTYKDMLEIDRLGAFESDDEVGTIFKTLKEMLYELKLKFID